MLALVINDRVHSAVFISKYNITIISYYLLEYRVFARIALLKINPLINDKVIHDSTRI